ncbi:MBL fold metallo-hydrolase [Actinomadura verrucosospora]|uniref:Beta-lactamase domain-containing protein n=1 Tax=Actinomadura verrucosospora TaxID=46165 RepID=A0A7D3VVY4_ACTVE|nr:MBL fold metallo-hydrolase [Actinomadura verrucosospora]QKG24119.1 beta-lactamase domain-containing protein [Actinomadura verrucosospora]
MQLTKHAHACVVLEKEGTTIVIDPGKFTPDAEGAVAAADAVLITHEHFDHFDDALLGAALDKRPDLHVYGPASVRDKLGEHGGRVRAVAAGDALAVGEFAVTVHGERHAVIHPDIPIVANGGYLIDGRLYHPGDAYHVPDVPVETLLLPTSGPWTKVAEAVDFVRNVRPSRLLQIHELMLSELGQNSVAAMLNNLTGLEMALLAPGDAREL